MDAYVKQLFGPYATISRIEKYVKEGLAASAYYKSVADSKKPGDGEIQAYYEENADDYDSVDYRLITVNAELPTEPTELADPVEESEDGEEAQDDEEAAYEPSEAEIEAAMTLAKAEAQIQLNNLAKDGELYENRHRTSITSLLQEWLFDGARKSGDTTVIEDNNNHRYYVLEFVNRYLDQTPSANVRIIIAENGNGQEILDDWMAGDATEDSFAALADQHSSINYNTPDGGLYEGIFDSDVPKVLADWIFDSGRAKGDTAVLSDEDSESTYVAYYVGTGDPSWKLNISSILQGEAMNEYMDEITAGMEVEDPHNYLYYLEVQAWEDAQAENQTDEGADAAGDIGDESDTNDAIPAE